jgi:hypothetical protein
MKTLFSGFLVTISLNINAIPLDLKPYCDEVGVTESPVMQVEMRKNLTQKVYNRSTEYENTTAHTEHDHITNTKERVVRIHKSMERDRNNMLHSHKIIGYEIRENFFGTKKLYTKFGDNDFNLANVYGTKELCKYKYNMEFYNTMTTSSLIVLNELNNQIEVSNTKRDTEQNAKIAEQQKVDTDRENKRAKEAALAKIKHEKAEAKIEAEAKTNAKAKSDAIAITQKQKAIRDAEINTLKSEESFLVAEMNRLQRKFKSHSPTKAQVIISQKLDDGTMLGTVDGDLAGVKGFQNIIKNSGYYELELVKLDDTLSRELNNGFIHTIPVYKISNEGQTNYEKWKKTTEALDLNKQYNIAKSTLIAIRNNIDELRKKKN